MARTSRRCVQSPDGLREDTTSRSCSTHSPSSSTLKSPCTKVQKLACDPRAPSQASPAKSGRWLSVASSTSRHSWSGWFASPVVVWMHRCAMRSLWSPSGSVAGRRQEPLRPSIYQTMAPLDELERTPRARAGSTEEKITRIEDERRSSHPFSLNVSPVDGAGLSRTVGSTVDFNQLVSNHLTMSSCSSRISG